MLELLSPAKNYDQGREAINHGADAVYIGAPAFGAREAAGNTLTDIERLAQYAHLYHARVFATVNTLLFDNEIEDAVRMLHQLYNAGVDAAIIQDLGLLECDLPPIELHASTQTHNADLPRIQFLQSVGFSRIILARETSLQQMQHIRRNTTVELESFVQGALCVCYSGQCYLSQYLNNRSGNRGCCAQPCRSAYDLYDAHGNLLRKDQHLLSLRDFSAADHLRAMIDAGITSFKIEGRLKDMDYVKNTTAYYRQLLDSIMEGQPQLRPASSGTCRFFFTPDLERTFNRGFTDYFLRQRQPMATLTTQKSLGKRIGTVASLGRDTITIRTPLPLTAGDGLCFFNPRGQLEGFLVNHVQGATIRPNRMPDSLKPGTPIWRNNDQAFSRQLQGRTAERTIPISLTLADTPAGLSLTLVDTDGLQATATIACPKEPARDPLRAAEQMQRQLSKLGDTPFRAHTFANHCAQPWFVPAAALNQLRRDATEQLILRRLDSHLQHRGHCPTLAQRQADTTPYFETTLDYRANIVNTSAERFYRQHGVQQLEYGLEKTHHYDGAALMTTQYCLRYELGICLKRNPSAPSGPLFLHNNGRWFRLQTDCTQCHMKLFAAPGGPTQQPLPSARTDAPSPADPTTPVPPQQ